MADNASFEDLFKQGTSSYQAKDYAKASEFFQSALAQQPSNATLLTNIALTEFQLGHKGFATAYFRKALLANPDEPTAQAGLKYVISQLEVKEIPHQIESFETLREKMLSPVSLTTFLTFTAILLFASGWSVLNYLGLRKKALLEEKALPATPVLGLLFSLLFVFVLFLTGAKLYDATISRGTILETKISAQAAPGENQAPLFDLYAGFEVIIKQDSGDYVQVTYPGGMTGWIKKSSIMSTSGR